MNGRSWWLGRIVWERKPGAPPPVAAGHAQGRRRAVASIIALSLVVVLLAACSGGGGGAGTSAASGGSASKAPYKIGAIVSLTGSYAALGAPEKNVIDMEVAKINAAGGVNGHPIDVVIEDDGTDNGKAVAAASKLIEQDQVLAILGASGTGETMAIRGDVDRAGIANVSMAGGNAITGQLDKNVFATAWSNALVVPFELKYLQAKGIKKIGILSDAGGFGKDGVAVLDKEMPKFGITAVAKETFNPTDTDTTPQLTKLKNSGAQAIVLWAAAGDATVLKNAAQLKITVPIIGSHGNAHQQVIEGAGPAAEGFTFAAGKILVPEAYGTGTPEYQVATQFIADYKAKYNASPNTFAGHAYDALHITVDAMKALPEGFTAAQLRDQIEKTSGYEGIGGVFTFSPTDHAGMAESSLVLYTVKDGKFTLVK